MPRGETNNRLSSHKNPPPPFFRRVTSGACYVNSIPNFGHPHATPHLRRRPRDRIAPQVHHARWNLPRLRQLIRIHPLIPLSHRITHVRPFSRTNIVIPSAARNLLFSSFCSASNPSSLRTPHSAASSV